VSTGAELTNREKEENERKKTTCGGSREQKDIKETAVQAERAKKNKLIEGGKRLPYRGDS